MKDWLKNKADFKIVDVRTFKGNFLPSILKKANNIPLYQGLCVIQSFEPFPLYSAMSELGYEYQTEKINEQEFHVYFFRSKESDKKNKKLKTELPLKPTAIVNFNTIDPQLAGQVVDFWKYIWAQENPAIDMKTRLLLSLANGVGARRMRQAVREFVKGYSVGITSAEFDEVFALFAWNQGIGFFASEIGPSALFKAYQVVKDLEEKNIPRSKIVEILLDKFGDNNSEVKTFF